MTQKNALPGNFWVPWLLMKQGESDIESGNTVSPPKGKIVQYINLARFQGRPVFVHLRHNSGGEGITVQAGASACHEDQIACNWLTPLEPFELDHYCPSHLLLTFADSILVIEVESLLINSETATLRLGRNYQHSRRRGQRFSGLGVDAEFTQNALMCRGDLVDFGAGSFLVRVATQEPSCFRWLNPEETVTLRLFAQEKLVFSGECRLIRQNLDYQAANLVFVSSQEHIKRFPAKRIRNPRKEINPPLLVQFIHPLTGRKIYREVFDISTSGFSLQESKKEETLFPGLILPQVFILHAGMLRMKCTSQVIFRRREGDLITFGLAILDMDICAFSNLSHIIANNTDSRAHVGTELDMDELWEFFFDTNFIYPDKYEHIHEKRDKLKVNYRRLYQDNLQISRHFTYEKNGNIYAHIAMLWAYERAWMIHHFAARPLENKLTGFTVLRQLLIFLNGFHRLPSAHMDYVITYYRPNNRIIERIFGGFASHINDLQACSQDLFSYFSFTPGERGRLSPPWTVRESSPADIRVLERFYRQISGGMLLEALSFRHGGVQSPALQTAYAEAGFIRKCQIYTLCYQKNPAALLMVNQSEPGLNFSELLNCVKIFVLEPELTSWAILSQTIDEVAFNHPLSCLPVMVYPPSYVEKENVPLEKQYQLWVLNVAYGGPFLEYLERKFRLRLT